MWSFLVAYNPLRVTQGRNPLFVIHPMNYFWYVPGYLLRFCQCGHPGIRTVDIYRLMLSVAAWLPLTSMSSSRSAHTVITPEYADFPIPLTPIPSGLNPSNGTQEIFLSIFCLTEWIYSDNHLCLLCSVYVMKIHLFLAVPNSLITNNQGYRECSRPQREFGYCCCWEALLGPPSIIEGSNFAQTGFWNFFGLSTTL